MKHLKYSLFIIFALVSLAQAKIELTKIPVKLYKFNEDIPLAWEGGEERLFSSLLVYLEMGPFLLMTPSTRALLTKALKKSVLTIPQMLRRSTFLTI